jgi:hypothetical protein
VVNDQHGQILQVEIVTFETAHIKRGKVRRAGTKFRGPVRVGAFYQVIAGYKYNSPLAQLQVGCKSAEAPSALLLQACTKKKRKRITLSLEKIALDGLQSPVKMSGSHLQSSLFCLLFPDLKPKTRPASIWSLQVGTHDIEFHWNLVS